MFRIPVLPLVVLLVLPQAGAAQGLWEDIKERASQAAETTRDTASKAADATRDATSQAAEVTGEAASRASDYSRQVTDDTSAHFQREGTPEEIRRRVDTMAQESLIELFREDPSARAMFEKSYGYAVFEVRQVSFTVTAGYGYGVAVEREYGSPTYMKMASGGVGFSLGVGGFAFQLVFLFEDEETFRNFVEHGYDASAEASKMIGDETDSATARFVDGVVVFKLTDKGYRVAAGLSGSRFWPDKGLN